MVFNVVASDHRRTVSPSELPFEIIELKNVPIPVGDGAVLYANVWLPKIAHQSKAKVGTLVEYLPYRKNDFTAARDSIRHPYYAGHGLASIRVDMRGSGDSDGVLEGEYLLQEQEDNLAVFDWIVEQHWSNGSIGQFGKSWGGFNCLQIAARQHPALKAVITLMSTDDRYSDDVHYRGGCLLASDMLWWASTMFAYNARPQDPEVRSDWRENWLQRLDVEPNVVDWVSHQKRDAFWKHGSICEDWSKVNVPVLAFGGWRDGYTNPVFRMMDNLPHPDCRGIVGPWVHEYPEVATPHPGVGYNQIAVQWFTRYLSTDTAVKAAVEKSLSIDDFDVAKLEKITGYVQQPASLAKAYEARDGQWVTQRTTGERNKSFFLNGRSLSLSGIASPPPITFSGAAEHGLFRGTWCPFGQDGDFPADQKIEDSKSFTVDSVPLQENISVFGVAVAKLSLSSDKELANVTVRVVDIDPETNEHILVSWGMANLSHLIGSHENPRKLVPHEVYDVDITLDAAGYVFKTGHVVRAAFSTTDWPSLWPSALTPKVTIQRGEVVFPLSSEFAVGTSWPIPESLAPCGREILREEKRTRKVIYDYILQTWTISDFSDEGKRTITSNGLEFGSWNKNVWSIKEAEPLSAFNQCDWELTLGRGSWQVKLLTHSTMRADEENFFLVNEIEAFEGEKQIFKRRWENAIPRDFV